MPKYAEHLSALNQQGIYVTPARSIHHTSMLNTWKYANNNYHVEMEKTQKNIPSFGRAKEIAPESIFEFFSEWEWHLDTRHTASGKDINPDVIGYIFEQYINEKERGEKGAYYTKEDITDYICKNCILPFLFDILLMYLKIQNPRRPHHRRSKPGGFPTR